MRLFKPLITNIIKVYQGRDQQNRIKHFIMTAILSTYQTIYVLNVLCFYNQ